jgi:formate dehydrogenase-N alpha subunit
MTNHWIDIGNSDCILIIGSNAAENHPISFKWVVEAKEKNGAKLISVDPRYTRTSSLSDIYAPLRSGTDIAFIGGMINYVLENKLYNEEYVREYTNAPFIISDKIQTPGELDGKWSGFLETADGGGYNKTTWQYEKNAAGKPEIDRTLQHPRCVFQIMKKHFARYPAEKACSITGTPKDVYLEVCRTYAATGAREKAGTIMYAMGTTQHTHGTQNVRSYAILQLLLGNMGVAGGGINALRGESNVQGSTDHCLLFHIIPGYLKCPTSKDQTLQQYLDKYTPETLDGADFKSVNYWKFTPRFTVSLLKAFYGDAAKPDNDFCYSYLPKRTGGAETYSHIALFEAMYEGTIKGLVCMGQNPAVGGPNAEVERSALERLDWLVAVDLWDTETMNFWQRPGVNPAEIKTEVFALPAAGSMEKEGSVTNSGRWAQWRYQAISPPGEAKSDLWILTELVKALKGLYAYEGGAFPDPILNMTWNVGGREEPDPHAVAKEINGYDVTTGKLLSSFGKLKEDGSTSSGNWLYCGHYTEAGNNAARRGHSDPSGIGLYPEWSWCWPVNRRIIYNRASCDINGKPWDPKHPVIKWDEARGKWIGDVPDYGATSHPSNRVGAFIMKPEGHACIWASGLADGPLPEHYEPLESPLAKNPMSGTRANPAITRWDKSREKHNPCGDSGDYPYVATTYRVTEHWQAGAMTRSLPWLVEMMPEPFVELSEQLAKEKGISNGDTIRVASARGCMSGRACVTKRFKPFTIEGKTVHEIGVPWHFGYSGLATGCSANCLTPHIGDANTMIPEFKAFLVNIEKVV